MKPEIDTLKAWIEQSKRIVFFGGAGVSTESKIPDFRSDTGLYKQKYPYPAETMLSHSFFEKHPEEFYDFYRNVMIYPDAKPNRAHYVLTALEQAGKLTAVVTQNIDGLHQAAGSRNVYELHGSVHRNYCMECGKTYGLDAITGSTGIPRCSCGGIIRPDVVLYEEGLDQDTLDCAVTAIAGADMLIVGGTSLAVYPAAGLIRYYRGNRLVLVNLQPTPYDDRADLCLHASLGETLEAAIGGEY
ncbi:MAG: NAD-dependent protein deacylase [Ruminococcaceae bacterium]|nr:NAD-dependent protein deacylase [Oscillospiraceae bacterium]